MIIDTHAHLYLSDFADDIDEVTERCRQKGVQQVLLPNIDYSTISLMNDLVKKYPNIYRPMIGLHPCNVKEDYQLQLDKLEPLLDDKNVVAVGEIGVDLYWDKTFREEQVTAFKTQIQWALDHDLPIVIHSRDSLDLTIDIVSQMQKGNLRGVFHCFNGTVDQGKRIIDLGFYMGIGGVLTYKNAGVDSTVSQLPIQSMVLETDAPYLSPVPYRGKRNESSYIVEVAKKLADIHDIDLDMVKELTTHNARALFSL